MTRRLDAEEAALWDRVIATVKPIHPQKSSPARGGGPKGRGGETASAESPTPPQTQSRKSAGPSRLSPTPAPVRPAPRTPSESLDASWDKRLASGRFEPEMTIDLHGLSRDMARHLLYRRVHDAEARGIRTILVITGKGHMPGPSPADLMEGRPTRGAIRADFPRWLGEDALSGRIAAVRRAHPRHGGAGAAYLILKRRRG